MAFPSSMPEPASRDLFELKEFQTLFKTSKAKLMVSKPQQAVITTDSWQLLAEPLRSVWIARCCPS